LKCQLREAPPNYNGLVSRSQKVDKEVWLAEGQQESWRAVIALLTTLPAAIENDLRRTAGLTMFEFTVLASLSEAPRRTLQMSALAFRADASLSRLSHVVTRLERRGWIIREVSGDDARATNAVLTTSGWQKVVATAPQHAQSVRDLVVNALSPSQFEQLGLIARKIGRSIHARTAAP
jgi:DNA-binding MarR family transcriptional regulator